MSDENDELGGGFKNIDFYITPLRKKLRDPNLRELDIEGGWHAIHDVEGLTLTVIHGPSGTKSEVLVSPTLGFDRTSFRFYPSKSAKGDLNLTMEAAHRFFWFGGWDGKGDPLKAYQQKGMRAG